MAPSPATAISTSRKRTIPAPRRAWAKLAVLAARWRACWCWVRATLTLGCGRRCSWPRCPCSSRACSNITKDIGASKRLLAAFGSAAIAWWLLGGVSRVGMAPVDYVLSFWPVSLVFTMFAVGGCTHALNIVDGMNGLAGMVATLMAVSISWWPCGRHADLHDRRRAGVGHAGLPGLELSVRPGLPGRRRRALHWPASCWPSWRCCWWCTNPSVSPFYALAVLFYPVFETGFSIWRRRFKRGVPVDQPDALHLHQLVFRRWCA